MRIDDAREFDHAATGRDGFQRKVRSSTRRRQNDPKKNISFFQKPPLKCAAGMFPYLWTD